MNDPLVSGAALGYGLNDELLAAKGLRFLLNCSVAGNNRVG